MKGLLDPWSKGKAPDNGVRLCRGLVGVKLARFCRFRGDVQWFRLNSHILSAGSHIVKSSGFDFSVFLPLLKNQPKLTRDGPPFQVSNLSYLPINLYRHQNTFPSCCIHMRYYKWISYNLARKTTTILLPLPRPKKAQDRCRIYWEPLKQWRFPLTL